MYSPGELDLNVLIGRCKEMPRKRDPEGKPQKFKMLPSQQMQQEAYAHASAPKGKSLCPHNYNANITLNCNCMPDKIPQIYVFFNYSNLDPSHTKSDTSV